MSWKVRHEGSPRAVEGLALAQVIQCLQDGLWEPTDEVMGPQDAGWVAFENHPQFAELAADLEPPPAKGYDDETRLDMNTLIDVCLVLLVFFILTAAVAATQKMIAMAGTTGEGVQGPPRVTKEKVEQFMIKVEVRQERRTVDGETKEVSVIKVEDKEVPRDALLAELTRYARASGKTELLIDHSPKVPHGVVVAIQDAAKGAGISRVHILVPKEEAQR